MAREPSTVNTQRGERVGKYEVLDHIATGGMGAVYRARDVESGQEVALKVLTPEMAAKPAMLERFRREARAAQKMQHENIVRVFDSGEANGTMFIAMEFIDGIDLHEHIELVGKVDPEESRQIMIQAARALAHAHGHGIVHRDIKPSNFMLGRKNGRLIVKLTDLGLAREQNNEQFRVTRAGTTVGTVDYISPEQARDSGVADERSDLYSLGCTWFHMLAGQPPFAKGGLAERLIKHMESPPPDIRKLNPKVSDTLVTVLAKLLAKKPDDRYQNAKELVHALQELNPTRKVAQAQRDTVHDLEDSPRKKPKSGTRKGKRSRSTAHDGPRPGTGSRLWIVVALASLLLLGGGGAVYLLLNQKGNPGVDPNAQVQVPVENGNVKPIPPNPLPLPPPIAITQPIPTPVQPAPKFAALYKPATALPLASLTRDFRAPWKEGANPPTDSVTVRVSRSPDGSAGWFPTLAAALAGTPGDKPLVVEFHDNGPLFETPVRVEGRSLVLRGGKGYHPLLVWDLPLTVKERPVTGPLHFVTLDKGSLWVENLELAVAWPEAQPANGDGIFSVKDGDLNLRDCTVSVAGKQDSLTLARLDGNVVRARFDRVQGRGDCLTVLTLDAQTATAAFDGCLFVGGKSALLQFAGSNERKLDLWAARSTFVGRKTLLSVESPPGQTTPGLQAHWWDCLLTRMGSDAAGQLFRLTDGAKVTNCTWQATNCLYVGWPLLLSGGERTVTGSEAGEWQSLWQRTEGEVSQPNPWPTPAVARTETQPPATYRTRDSREVCFASTSDPNQPLGAPLELLPPSRDNWLSTISERYPLPMAAFLDGTSPTVPPLTDGLYHGEVIDLATVNDLGLYLAGKKKFGPRVVVILRGSGEKVTSPIRMPPGSSLTLYAEPPVGDALPLTLRFVLRPGSGFPALITTEGGGLELSNLELKLAEGAFVQSTPYFLQTRGGSLHLFRVRMQTNPTGLAGLKGLISAEGSNLAEWDKANQVTLTESVLMTGQSVIRLGGTGVLLAARGSLFVASGSALEFDLPAGVGSRLSLGCSLENCTLATRGPALVIGAATVKEIVQEPFVVQTQACLFLNPFDGAVPALLHVRGLTLAHGLVLWQSDEDAIDARIPRAVVSGEDKTLHVGTANRIWGSSALQKPVALPVLKLLLDGKTWTNVDPLILPRLPGDRKVGADLVALGVKKKKP